MFLHNYFKKYICYYNQKEENMTISQAVTARINELLIEKGMTWYRLEHITGLSKGTIIGIQYSRYKSVNLTTLVVIIRALGVSIDEFFKSPLFTDENLDY